MSTEKREIIDESGAGSDLEAVGDSSDGNMNSSAIIPKKRGRPLKKKQTVASGRGRGRPSKNAPAVTDDASPTVLANGNKKVAAGRGRPPKAGKQKVAHTISPTGKGRGRPKNSFKTTVDDDEDDEEEEEEEDDDDDEDYDDSADEVPKKKPKAANKAPGKRGRPKKTIDIDENGTDDDLHEGENRNPGRPATGGVNLNIVRSGRGQGRPKKSDEAKKRSADGASDSVPKKRGRPAASIKSNAAGGARGRPKAKRASSAEDLTSNSNDEIENNEDSAKGDELSDEEFTNGDKKHSNASPTDIAAV